MSCLAKRSAAAPAARRSLPRPPLLPESQRFRLRAPAHPPLQTGPFLTAPLERKAFAAPRWQSLAPSAPAADPYSPVTSTREVRRCRLRLAERGARCLHFLHLHLPLPLQPPPRRSRPLAGQRRQPPAVRKVAQRSPSAAARSAGSVAADHPEPST